MGRSCVRLLATWSNFVLLGSCLAGCGFKLAGSSSTGAGAGTQSGGTGGSVAGAAGAAGSAAGGSATGGGTAGSAAMAGAAGASGGSKPMTSTGGGSGAGSSAANCGARSKTAMKVPPDILILLDRSGSMNDDVNNQSCRPDGGGLGATTGCGADSKWAHVAPAIVQVVSETEADVNWGLKFFPDNSSNSCNVSNTAAVDVGPGNGAAIATAIMGATSANGGVVPYNGTPTRSAEGAATAYLQALTGNNPKFVLLATDGIPTCAAAGAGGGRGGGGLNADDSAGALSAVDAAHMAGVSTFVVGIATGGGDADTTLSKIATAGGLARSGTPSYYPVTSAEDLASAIRTLIGVASTCTFQIGPTPTDTGSTSLEHIDVVGDGKPIDRDMTHQNGYDYVDASEQSIQVYGPLCDQIMTGAIHDVTVTFRCLVN